MALSSTNATKMPFSTEMKAPTVSEMYTILAIWIKDGSFNFNLPLSHYLLNFKFPNNCLISDKKSLLSHLLSAVKKESVSVTRNSNGGLKMSYRFYVLILDVPIVGASLILTLTLYSIYTHFNTLKKKALGIHGGKR